MSWHERAECAGENVNLFFTKEAVPIAKRICSHCPVRQQCLNEVIEENDVYGVWGGLTADERSALKRRRQQVPA